MIKSIEENKIEDQREKSKEDEIMPLKQNVLRFSSSVFTGSKTKLLNSTNNPSANSAQIRPEKKGRLKVPNVRRHSRERPGLDWVKQQIQEFATINFFHFCSAAEGTPSISSRNPRCDFACF